MASFLPALLSLGAGVSFSACAAPVTHTLDIPAEPPSRALVALALQTGISIGGADPAACGARTRALHGDYSPEDALRAMLTGSRCVVKRYDAVTFRLQLKPVKPAKVRPAPPVAVPPQAEIAAPDSTLVVIQRRPQSLDSVAAPVSVAGRDVLSGNDYDLSRLAARVPGMAVTNLGPGRDKILLRGISDSVLTGRTQSLVGLYLDDAPVTYNAPDPDLPLIDMARVEVLKGPQGALYGQGSLAGVVRMATNRPQAESYEGEIGAAYGLTETGKASWRTSAMVNLPLVHDRLALRGVMYDENYGGFIHDGAPGKGSSNTTGRYGGRVALRWNIDGNFSLTATAVGQHLNSSNSQYVFSPNAGYQRSALLAEPHDNNFGDIAFGLDGEMAWGTLKISFNRIRHGIHTGYDARPLGPIVSVPNSGVLFYDENQNILLSTQEISVVSPSSRRFRWMAGLFSAESTEHFTPHLVDVFTGRTLYNEDRLDRSRDAALFGQVSYDITPRWTASLGLRAAWDRHETSSQINHVRLTNYERMGDVVGRIRSRPVTHNLLLSYRATPRLVLYAQTADGFRTGGFNTTTLAVTAIPSQFQGDHLDNFETGLRWRSGDNRLRMNLSAFFVDWRDIQSDQLRSTGLPVTLNLGDGTNRGVEMEADWRVAEAATLHLAAQLNNPRLDRPNPLFTRDQGSGMPYIARSSFSLSADWVQTVAGLKLRNSAIFSWRSKSPLNYGPLRNVRMDALGNLDLASSFSAGRLTFTARLDNAAAARGNSFAYGNPFSLNGPNQITPVRPRTLWIEVSRRY